MQFQLSHKLPLNINDSLQLLHKNNRQLEQLFIPKIQKGIAAQDQIKIQSKEFATQTIDQNKIISPPILVLDPHIHYIIDDQIIKKQAQLQQITEQFNERKTQVDLINQKKGRILQLRTILEHRLQQKYSKSALQCEKNAHQIYKQEKDITKLNKQNAKLRLICEQFQSL